RNAALEAGIVEIAIDLDLVVRRIGAAQEAELHVPVEVLAFALGNLHQLVALALHGIHAAQKRSHEKVVLLAHGAAKRNRVARGDPDWRHRLLDATNGDGGRRNVDELAMILERLLGQAERNDIRSEEHTSEL